MSVRGWEGTGRGGYGLSNESIGDVEQIRDELARAVARLCPQPLRAHQDDMVQKALLKVMARKSEEIGPPPSSYLHRTAYSVVVDACRHDRRKAEVDLDDSSVTMQLPRHEQTPEQTSLGYETGRAIRACLAVLRTARRRAVVLRLLGHSVPESAALLDWSPKRTENLVRRGLMDLRACLERKGLAP